MRGPPVAPAGDHAQGAHLNASSHTSLVALLTDAYGARDPRLTPIQDGVFRVDSDSTPPWVARHFPATRPFERVEGDAAVLHFLRDLPVEQLVEDGDGRAATSIDGRGVIVTRFVDGPPARPTTDTLRRVGAVVGAVHSRQPPAGDPHLERRAGALPREDLAFARSCLDDARDDVPAAHRATFERLSEAVATTDDCESLPHRLLHSDCHLGNVIDSSQGPVLFDWEGAGRGPAVAALGWLLYTAAVHAPGAPRQPFDPARVDAVLTGYTAHVPLTGDEVERLADAVRFRPLVVAAREFRDSVRAGEPARADGWWSAYAEAERVADHALHYFG